MAPIEMYILLHLPRLSLHVDRFTAGRDVAGEPLPSAPLFEFHDLDDDDGAVHPALAS